jgi:L-fuconolactonase
MAEGKLMQSIVDSHFHIWRQADLPWLQGPMVPRIFGPYEAIRRDYDIDEYRAAVEGAGVSKAIYVQTNWAKSDFEAEAAWVQETAHETGWPHGIVAYADMTVADVRPQLDRLARYPLVRGVRMQLHWHAVPEFRFAPGPDQVVDPRVRKNVARLEDYGFSFDLQLFPTQMRHGAELVGENPGIDFILTHAGMLTDSDAETVEAWERGLRMLAKLPNLFVKLSGLGTFVHRNEPALIALIVDCAISIFGSDRLMFGSNLPIESLWTNGTDHRAAVAPHGEKAEAAIFRTTAERVYRPG